MELVKELYRCQNQIELELHRQVDHSTELSLRTKRLRVDNDRSKSPGQRKFEEKLVRLKGRWNQLTNAIFYSERNIGIYDKLAYDLAKSFHNFYASSTFSGDQLEYAFRCTIIPVVGQIIEEDELGKKASDRQKRRKGYLLKLLSFGFEDRFSEAGNGSPGSDDGFIDVCSASPISRRNESSGSDRINTAQSSNQRGAVRYIKPTPVTIIIVDILIDALIKFAELDLSKVSTSKERIYHIMNIAHVMDILETYFTQVKQQIEDDEECGPRKQSNLSLLKKSISDYELKLRAVFEKRIHVTQPQVVFKNGLNLIYMQLLGLRELLQ